MNAQQIMVKASLVAALLSAGTASAADDLIDAPEVTISAASAEQGLYLRGDLGYAGWSDAGDPSVGLYNSGTGNFDGVSVDEGRFGKPFSGSMGVGYQLNDMLRADVTGDYFSGRFDGEGSVSEPCDGEGAGTVCAGREKGDFDAIGVMANAYVDLGTVAGFTPYVGGGLGATRLSWDDVSFRTRCAENGGLCNGAGDVTTSYGGEDSWRFTYALMAGLSYDLTERLKIDVNYRYSHIGDGDMFQGAAVRGNDDGLTRHEIRAGLRLSIW